MAKAFLARTPYLKFSRFIASIRCWVFKLVEYPASRVIIALERALYPHTWR